MSAAAGSGASVLGFAVLVGFCLINAAGTRAGGATQVVLSSAKGVVLTGLVVVLFAQPGHVLSSAPANVPIGGWMAFATAILVIIGTYNGWADLVIYGEEIANPGRAIPRAMFGGIIGVAVLYLLVNLALLHVRSPAAMAGSDFAAADATAGVFGSRGGAIFTAFGVLSVGAIANLSVMTNSRLVFAMARGGMLPRGLTRVSALGTPLPAMLASSAFAAMFLVSGTYLALSATSVSLSQAMLAVTAAVALAWRARFPDAPRPYRAPFQPWSLWLALGLNVALLGVFILQDPANALLGFALVTVLSVGALVFGKVTDPAIEPTEPLAGADLWQSPN
ncbi:APC family permease [Novosphingobium sp. Gsoil 351]|uniref:APC family permease n=1 Tax=Novosphingobium sp. Gsoil 351 TaxID=2675225 RepID=UPI0018A8738F|nr:APC family permease [Novosphingobium sp. Gsoil 351]